MNIYLDVSCLNRPFDDQSQVRIRLEAEAVVMILDRVEHGGWSQVSSGMAVAEVAAIPDDERRSDVQLLMPQQAAIVSLTPDIWKRAADLATLGFKPADATHVAAAEVAGADVFLSCDDKLCRHAKRRAAELKVRVANPLDWLKEIDDAENA